MDKFVRIGDLCNVRSSKRVFEEEWESQGIPFYRAREVVLLNKNGYVNNELFISHNKYRELKGLTGVPKVGDILITAVGTLGVTYIVENSNPFYFKDGNLLWIEVRNKIESRYLQYLFMSSVIKKQIKNFALTTTVGTYTISSAKKTIIPYPSFSEQNAIANFLDEKTGTIDSAVEELVKQRKLLEELKQATIYKAVTKGLDDNAEMKDSGVEWIGEIPKDKNLKKIKNILKVFDKSKVQVNEADIVGKYPFFTSSKKLSKRIDSPLLEDEEVIIMGTGGFANVHYYKGDLSYSTDCWCVKSIENVKFLYYYLTSIKSAINTLGFNGMGLKHLQKDFINSNFVVSFDIEEQNKIVSFLDVNKIRISVIEIEIPLTSNGKVAYSILLKNILDKQND